MRSLVASLIIFILIFQSLSTISPVDDVLKKVKLIEREVESIRGIKPSESPKFIVITRRDALMLFSPYVPNEEMKIKELIYKVTFILPPQETLFKVERENTANWIAATVGNKVYVIRENFLKSGDIALRATAHELTHVLQRELIKKRPQEQTLDERLAFDALIEGDADLVADIFCEKNGIRIIKIENISRNNLYWSLNVFPYVFGDRFVRFLYSKGGWKLVNSAYKEPPTSTKVVMFPELYLQGWKPVQVKLNVTGVFNDTLGAYYVFLISWRINNWSEAMNIARHWMGDRIVVVNRSEVIWKVVFSSEDSAKKFEDTLKHLAMESNFARYEIWREDKTVFMKAQVKPPSS
ncbi:hypothetical protein [Pyrococcus abyssi]|uniref:DUF4157 domain-containing protein n=1 Tax=Pyrococcus abyssi (strain GE5 / Orsay) TaxID=272844 RepID=Q9V248_PYRAB|nr:hypothetical protein [Pyrococcus abyssi]CAB49150.1 Hypothetical protein PAB2200 [Pyrococcus abyssi GE5]CCE69602.1 TPA: hypothetical protein PAB2200 [Pyrococcus abyssi GE5]